MLSRRNLLGLAMALPAGHALAATTPSWPGALVMGTGAPGGAYALYGLRWGELARAATGVDIAFRASGGAEANILLLEQNAAQLGMTTVAVAEVARNGSAPWTAGAKFQVFRALFPMFPTMLQIVSPRQTGITTLAELAGQVIGIGPDGSSGAVAVPRILSSLGVLPSRTVMGDYNNQIEHMLAGRLAACAFMGAPPLPAIARAAIGRQLALIGLTVAESAQVSHSFPGMTRQVLDAGLFPGQSLAVGTVGTVNFAIGSASLPDTLAAALTRAALRNRPALAAAVPAAAAPPSVDAMLHGGITFHPGARDALREFGMDVPEKFIER
jgi:uncharacterized protein